MSTEDTTPEEEGYGIQEEEGSSYVQTLCRDGAYMELDMADPDFAVDDVLQARMITVRNVRLELSDPAHVAGFQKALDDLVNSSETEGMDDVQLMHYVFRQVLDRGLENYSV